MPRYRTPLRYPGGKQKLTPFIREILFANELEGCHYVEPYAGGAGVAMELLTDGLISHAHLNDSSIHIYSFWKACLEQTEEFCRRISRASLDVDEWKIQREVLRNHNQHEELEVGFATFYLNRTNRSGVLRGGVIGGMNQTGEWKIDARFPRLELIRRIEVIAALKDKITLSNLDAEIYFEHQIAGLPENALIYCDPPYFEKGSRLYLNHYAPGDHERISEVVQGLTDRNWIVSYDGAPEILEYYTESRQFLYELQYNAAKAYKGNEVFIFSDKLVIPRTSSLSFITTALTRYSKQLHR